MSKTGYTNRILNELDVRYADQPEFLQTVHEVLNSIRPVIDKDEEKYERDAILERLTEPDR